MQIHAVSNHNGCFDACSDYCIKKIAASRGFIAAGQLPGFIVTNQQTQLRCTDFHIGPKLHYLELLICWKTSRTARCTTSWHVGMLWNVDCVVSLRSDMDLCCNSRAFAVDFRFVVNLSCRLLYSRSSTKQSKWILGPSSQFCTKIIYGSDIPLLFLYGMANVLFHYSYIHVIFDLFDN